MPWCLLASRAPGVNSNLLIGVGLRWCTCCRCWQICRDPGLSVTLKMRDTQAALLLQVPADLQSSVRKAYWTYLGMAACMVWNSFGSLMALIIIGNGDGRLTGDLWPDSRAV